MKVLIDGFNTNGIFLGSLLALKGHEVAFVPGEHPEQRVSSLRICLPDRWLQADNLKHKMLENPDILIISPPELRSRPGLAETLDTLAGALGEGTHILLLDVLRPGEEILHPALSCGLALWQAAMLQPDQIELYSAQPWLVLEKDKILNKVLSTLKNFNLKLKLVEALLPYYNSACLYQLSYLPVALASSTHEHFLSFPEGRKIIGNLLQESLKIFEQHGEKLASLPVMDPRRLMTLIQKNPESYRIHRYLPARQLNQVRQAFILGQQQLHTTNHSLSALADEVGIEIFWNRRLVGFLEERTQVQSFKSPLELLKAIE